MFSGHFCEITYQSLAKAEDERQIKDFIMP